MRFGISTGGGDCPGLNAAIRSVVQVAHHLYQAEIIGIPQGLSGLLQTPASGQPLSLATVENIHDWGGTILGTNNKGSPFRDPKQKAQVLKETVRGYRQLKLDGMFVIGGDGTQLMARHLVEAGLNVIGIPKTIDNDLVGSDLAIGFQTAVDVATDAAARLLSSAAAHNRLMVLEVMGRNAGHIALATGMAAGAHSILIPEIPFEYDVLAAWLKHRQERGSNAWLMIVAEGAAAAGKEISRVTTPTGGSVLGGIGARVVQELHGLTGIDGRATVLGHLQRGGRPNAGDRILAMGLAAHAVKLAASGKFGRVAAIKDNRVTDFSYERIGDKRRLVDVKGDLVAAAKMSGITFGDQWPQDASGSRGKKRKK